MLSSNCYENMCTLQNNMSKSNSRQFNKFGFESYYKSEVIIVPRVFIISIILIRHADLDTYSVLIK